MEKFSQQNWGTGYGETVLLTKAGVTSTRYDSDVMIYNVTIEVNNIHSLNAVQKLDFSVGKDQQWRFKYFPVGRAFPNYYACAICLLNVPNCYPVQVPAILTSSSTNKGKCLSKSIMPTEVWGFKYSTLNESTFVFQMVIIEKVPIIYKSIQNIEDRKETIDKIKLSDHFELLFTAGDLTLFGSDWELCCHKQILVDKSPVFKVMFEHDMIESKICRVEIKDIKGSAIRAMLLYLYTDEPVGLSTYIEELTYAAVKYQIEGLKTHCINYMMNNLSVESAVDFVFLCDICDSEEFRERLVSFIAVNLENITLTNEWQQVEKLSKTLGKLIKVQAFIGDNKKEET